MIARHRCRWYPLGANPPEPWKHPPSCLALCNSEILRRISTRASCVGTALESASPPTLSSPDPSLERPGELITREELRAKLWPDEVYVDFEHSLNAAVKKLRQALCDSPEIPPLHRDLSKARIPIGGQSGGNSLTGTNHSCAGTGCRTRDTRESAGRGGGHPLVPTSPGNGTRKRATFYAVVSLVLVALVWIGYREFRRESARPLAPNGNTMLAVLPFDNLTGDPAREYLSDGLTEELITELGGIGPDHFGVIARTL